MPFVAGALYFNPPVAFVSLMPAYVVGKYFATLSTVFICIRHMDHRHTSYTPITIFKNMVAHTHAEHSSTRIQQLKPH